ncbi:MAG: RiPP maturation radical SAM C-methyltransferase [bacterium]
MSRPKVLLISLPWASYHSPSLQIGALAAYARRNGFDAEARHAHLDIAASVGLNEYDEYSYKTYRSCGDALCAAILFPSAERRLLRYSEKILPGSTKVLPKLEHAMKDVYRRIDWKRYSLVGFTVTFDQLFASLLFSSWLKRNHPNIRILLGGRAVAGKMGRSVLKCFPWVDWVIDGEGEIGFVELLKGMRDGSSGFERDVPSLFYREGNLIKFNPVAQLQDLSGLPDPDFTDYYRTIEAHPKLSGTEILNYIPIEVSRGCVFKCAFCCDFGFWRGYRSRPAKETAAAIRRACRKYKVNSINLVAQLIAKKDIEALFPLILKQDIDYRFFCEIRADTTKENLSLMKRAGLAHVQIGIEALDSGLLRKMNKGTKLIENIRAMKYCEELGIGHTSNLMLGFPTESQDDIDRTVKAIDDMASAYMPPESIVRFQLREGSPVYFQPKKFGIKKICERSAYAPLLPKDISRNIDLWYKKFSTNRKNRNYSALMKRWRRWKKDYEEARRSGRPMLHYFDCKDHIKIEDSRHGGGTIILDGLAAGIYRFCDSVRKIDEIQAGFPGAGTARIREILGSLIDLRLMMTEEGEYLSLAIHSSPNLRRHLPVI